MKQNSLVNLAIIMDGNGRWAKERGLSRSAGHEKGAETIRDITEYCSKHNTIKTLTLYAFSTENWKRPKLEVDFLMKLLEKYLEREFETYKKFDIKFETIGDLSKFSTKLQKKIENVKNETKNNQKLTQILALNYGSRDEIIRAVNKLIKQNIEITEKNISSALDTPYSDIDLLIRTSGEQRMSNFLLWQTIYSELFFTPTLWPDFTSQELDDIINEYYEIDRKFGGL
ncbi:MAG: di-trans,poly-cis-decaprenylcistransferase [Sulfurovaceae bacterium]|nr:di-trans,poly-cis-decaprenylcistransferase [Sulfurovaceae bacterium]MDD5549003.1 di-trans,poly-cis-decaprenylcistransferase [Sulfurovaceae bacterium]